MKRDLLAYARIGRPLEAHDAHSIEEERAKQRDAILRRHADRPARPWRMPWSVDADELRDVAPFISGGRWQIACLTCADCPSYDPEWQFACCWECGAIYEGVKPPAGWTDIERAVMVRPFMHTRNWRPPETVDDLQRETLAHGL